MQISLRRLAAAIAVSGIVALLLTPIFVNLSRFAVDFGDHLEFADHLYELGTFDVSHFGFHIGIVVLRVGGMSPRYGAILLATLSTVATGLILFHLLERVTDMKTSIGLSIALLVVGPLSFVGVWTHSMYRGYLVPNLFHSPTYVLLKPFALGLTLASLLIFKVPSSRNRVALLAGTAGLSIASVLVKPSFQIAFLPAVGVLVVVAMLRSRPVDWSLFLFGLAIPTAVVLMWQFTVTFAGGGPAGITFAPFQGLLALSKFPAADLESTLTLIARFLASLAFPGFVAYAYFRDGIKSTFFRVAWTTLSVAFLISYGMLETGPASASGNMFWGTHMALFVVYVSSVYLLLRQPPSATRNISWALFAAHLVSGVIFAVTQAGSSYYLWW